LARIQIVYLPRKVSPSPDRTILFLANTHQRHISIQNDKNMILFGNHILGIYLVYIPGIYVGKVLTGIHQVYSMGLPDAR
jgi:hypothetical protein